MLVKKRKKNDHEGAEDTQQSIEVQKQGNAEAALKNKSAEEAASGEGSAGKEPQTEVEKETVPGDKRDIPDAVTVEANGGAEKKNANGAAPASEVEITEKPDIQENDAERNFSVDGKVKTTDGEITEMVSCYGECIKGTFGVNYGKIADNLPAPGVVVTLLRAAKIKNIKIYDADHEVLKAFKGSGIEIIVGIGNEYLKEMSVGEDRAISWIKENVQPFLPGTKIVGITVGNEILGGDDHELWEVDAAYAALEKAGFPKMEVIVSETGWASRGDANEAGATLQNARTYNYNLKKRLSKKKGTPYRPKTVVRAYIFALFNENLKPGPTSERNFGLFKPDGSIAYDIGFTGLKESSAVSYLLSFKGIGASTWLGSSYSLVSATCTAVLLLVSAFDWCQKCAAAQTVHVVGKHRYWTIPQGGAQAYTNWANGKNFVVGDILTFNFTTNEHDVLRVQKDSFDACSSSNSIERNHRRPCQHHPGRRWRSLLYLYIFPALSTWPETCHHCLIIRRRTRSLTALHHP
ncbi:hypothetical protein GH714_034266 [Hevea brasiliensis]|uniref:glucan endo-1,3-beta-D-glucosidase n=1 Tax=Hevea brasiliensis TaxID=3981 RepID=A0A6A6NDY8_HEVBR|nr:hypothetical protein GH714_034266 [Hevea brasiliensis]